MEYIKIEDGIVTGHRAGRNPGEGWVETPKGFWGAVGDSVDWYDNDWHRIDDVTLIKFGKMEMPDGMKFNDDKTGLVQMDEEELIIAGQKPLPDTLRIEDGKLIAKTNRELWLEGIISELDFELIKRQERDAMLSSTDKYMIADFPVDDEYRQQIREYRQSLRDITKSTEWPDVDIPSIPTK